MGYRTINPANGEVVATYPDMANGELSHALDRAQRCYSDDWASRSKEDRAEIVARAATILRAKADQYACLLTLEMGKLFAEAKAEVKLSADILAYYASNGPRFLAPEKIPGREDAMIESLPLGVILAVEPWNFPYYQLARVAGPGLVAGNTFLVKHASSVPQSALAFERLIRDAGAPEGVWTNIFATFEQVGNLIDDPRIKGVAVTGSERAGAVIAARAGSAMKKSVLELGGSDPFIVLEDAPLEPTIDNAVWGRMNNMGQSCVASKRIIVVGRERAQVFLKGLVGRLEGLRAGDPMDPSTTLAPLSSEKAVTGLQLQVEKAVEAGAKLVLGGSRLDRPGFYFAPTVLTEIEESNPAYRQEFFGPVVSFYTVDTEAQAIALANSSPYGLGSSIFTADLERGRSVARMIESGMSFVNRPTWTAPELPFGGVKNSGYGRELSHLGIAEFLNRKLISVSASGLRAPSIT